MIYNRSELCEMDHSLIINDKIMRIYTCLNMNKEILHQFEYFEVCMGNSSNKTLTSTLISINSPEYIDYQLDDFDPEFEDPVNIRHLTKDEIEYLIRILTRNNNEIWKSILKSKNQYYEEEYYSLDLPIPDYTKLPE